MADFQKIIVSIDGIGDDAYEGFTNNRYWNGWETPYFTKEVAEKIVKSFENVENASAYYDAQNNQYCFDWNVSDKSDDEIEYFEGTTIIYENESIEVFPIGAFSWCWAEHDDCIEKWLNENIPKIVDSEPIEGYFYEVTTQDSWYGLNGVIVERWLLENNDVYYVVNENKATMIVNSNEPKHVIIKELQDFDVHGHFEVVGIFNEEHEQDVFSFLKEKYSYSSKKPLDTFVADYFN